MIVNTGVPSEGKKMICNLYFEVFTKGITMKIIGINASPKGNSSNTLQLVKSVLNGAESEGAETELVDLYKLNIEYCTACGTCYAKGGCPLIDDFEELI